MGVIHAAALLVNNHAYNRKHLLDIFSRHIPRDLYFDLNFDIILEIVFFNQ